MENYIAYNAGCNIWEVEKYDPSKEWHQNEYRGTKSDCHRYAHNEMYPNRIPVGSIWDV